jgi:two-component system response regulator RegA
MYEMNATGRAVLVVDDDQTLLSAYERGLGRDFRVVTATDSVRANAAAREHHPEIAIVDLRLGTESGIELIRTLKRDHPNMFVVLVTGNGSIEVAVQAMRAGADDVVAKPVRSSEIIRRLGAGRASPEETPTPTLAMAEWEHIHRVLADCGGNVSMAARKLGIYRSSLQRRLKKQSPAT